MERSAWTGERLDDFAASVTQEVRLLRTEMRDEFRAVRQEMHEGLREVRAEILDLRADFSAWQRQIAQIGWALVVALIGAVVAIVVAIV
jgi:hypothetical protein